MSCSEEQTQVSGDSFVSAQDGASDTPTPVDNGGVLDSTDLDGDLLIPDLSTKIPLDDKCPPLVSIDRALDDPKGEVVSVELTDWVDDWQQPGYPQCATGFLFYGSTADNDAPAVRRMDLNAGLGVSELAYDLTDCASDLADHKLYPVMLVYTGPFASFTHPDSYLLIPSACRGEATSRVTDLRVIDATSSGLGEFLVNDVPIPVRFLFRDGVLCVQSPDSSRCQSMDGPVGVGERVSWQSDFKRTGWSLLIVGSDNRVVAAETLDPSTWRATSPPPDGPWMVWSLLDSYDSWSDQFATLYLHAADVGFERRAAVVLTNRDGTSRVAWTGVLPSDMSLVRFSVVPSPGGSFTVIEYPDTIHSGPFIDALRLDWVGFDGTSGAAILPSTGYRGLGSYHSGPALAFYNQSPDCPDGFRAELGFRDPTAPSGFRRAVVGCGPGIFIELAGKVFYEGGEATKNPACDSTLGNFRQLFEIGLPPVRYPILEHDRGDLALTEGPENYWVIGSPTTGSLLIKPGISGWDSALAAPIGFSPGSHPGCGACAYFTDLANHVIRVVCPSGQRHRDESPD